jgi:hypothetical protein
VVTRIGEVQTLWWCPSRARGSVTAVAGKRTAHHDGTTDRQTQSERSLDTRATHQTIIVDFNPPVDAVQDFLRRRLICGGRWYFLSLNVKRHDLLHSERNGLADETRQGRVSDVLGRVVRALLPCAGSQREVLLQKKEKRERENKELLSVPQQKSLAHDYRPFIGNVNQRVI